MYKGIYTCFRLIYYRTVSFFGNFVSNTNQKRAKTWYRSFYMSLYAFIQWLYLPDKWVLRVWGIEGRRRWDFLADNKQSNVFLSCSCTNPRKRKIYFPQCTYARRSIPPSHVAFRMRYEFLMEIWRNKILSFCISWIICIFEREDAFFTFPNWDKFRKGWETDWIKKKKLSTEEAWIDPLINLWSPAVCRNLLWKMENTLPTIFVI